VTQINFRGESHIREALGVTPNLGARVLIDPTAVVMGDVWLGDDASVWPHVAMRGDVQIIRIGARTNIQDGTVLHVTHEGPYNPDGYPLHIGDDVTVGHRALLHGCTVGHRVLVGMGAIVMDKVVVEDEVMIAAGSLVTPGKRLRSGHLYAGSPAREVRALSESEQRFLQYSADGYVSLKQRYLDSSN
jgi:carbonic anhydrase/acetyltransferase-like protein (isoleucine patch superfamily)